MSVSYGFNEAAIFRSRKPTIWAYHGCSISSFNEAAIFRSRKQRNGLDSSYQRSCFNEAAIFRSRKHPGPADEQLHGCDASMRPRSFDRGNRRGVGNGRLRKIASMRPRSFDRGNDGDAYIQVDASDASMRPRSFDRGNEVDGGPRHPESECFNEAAIFRSRKPRRGRAGG